MEPLPSVLHMRLLPSRWQWIEVCAFSGTALIAGHWFAPADPYLTTGPLSWLWLAPVLLGLRYGMWAGLLSEALFLLGLIIEVSLGLLPASMISKPYIIGGIMLTMICGEFGSRWNLRLSQIAGENEYLSTRYKEISDSYQLLGMSHHYLQQSWINKPLTLRDAFLRLRGMLVDHEDETISPAIAQRFLHLLTQYFQLEVAAVYLTNGVEIQENPVAVIGQPIALDFQDSLVRYAVETGEFSHILTKEPDGPLPSQYLILAPARTSDNATLAWLAVERMRFLNLHYESLYMLKVFLSYFADSIQASNFSKPVLEVYPDCPQSFAKELPRLVRLKSELGIGSSLVVFAFYPNPLQEQMIEQVKRSTRGLDLVWDVQGENGRAICVLMPFSDDAAVEGYLSRVQQLMKEKFGVQYDQADIHVVFDGLETGDAVSILLQHLSWCHDSQDSPVLTSGS